MTPSNKERIGGYSNYVVGALMACGFIYLAYSLGGYIGGTALTLLLLYEGWTLVNNFPEDTLSESMWRFSARPMVPLVFGVADGLWTYHIFLVTPLIDAKQALLWGAIQFLFGHFFFQAKREEKKTIAEEIATKLGQVSLAPTPEMSGAVSVADHTGKVAVVREAMGLKT